MNESSTVPYCSSIYTVSSQGTTEIPCMDLVGLATAKLFYVELNSQQESRSHGAKHTRFRLLYGSTRFGTTSTTTTYTGAIVGHRTQPLPPAPAPPKRQARRLPPLPLPPSSVLLPVGSAAFSHHCFPAFSHIPNSKRVSLSAIPSSGNRVTTVASTTLRPGSSAAPCSTASSGRLGFPHRSGVGGWV